MPDSDRSRPTISLPQGGGAIKGLGETFKPDPFTGSGSVSIPLTLPTGRGNFHPELSLAYGTGQGNGPFGLGWSLDVPGVTRKTSKGIPRYDDDRDVFILSGTEDLVEIDSTMRGTARVRRYRPRTEGLFARIERIVDADSDVWDVTTLSGVRSVYGTTGLRGADPAAVAGPATGTPKVFRWLLSRTIDPFGNVIEYDYDVDESAEPSRPWRQLYLSQIRYVDYDDAAGQRRFAAYVDFDYEWRGDAFSEYRAGFEIRTRRRCRRIRVSTQAPSLVRVRDYELAYRYAPFNGVSLLTSVTLAGHGDPDTNGDQAVQRLPPLELEYSEFDPAGRRFTQVRGDLASEASLASPVFDLADLTGSGLPDIVEISDRIRYWRNRGGGEFDEGRLMPKTPAGLALAEPGVQLADADGDGRIDLLVSRPALAGYFPLTLDAAWEERGFRQYRRAPSFSTEDPDVRLVDLDGDGVMDAIRSGTRMECYFNDPREGWTDVAWFERGPLDAFPDVSFSDARVRLADMTGDGLQDIVLVHNRSVSYWPNLGRGRWAARVRMSSSPQFEWDYDPKRILIGDVDGDGLADIVYVGDGDVHLWINQGGNGFSPRVVVRGTPPASHGTSLRLADLEGTGVSGVLWSADAGLVSRRRLRFLDFTGGRKPYLLARMSNNLGATTVVRYTTSTAERIRDERSPETRWRTPLPFPVQVVSRVETIDEISGGKRTQAFSYHHGCWDGAEREFRGFALVDELDSESFDDYETAGLHGAGVSFASIGRRQFAPPTLTRTWFHVGPVGEEFGNWIEPRRSQDYWSGDPPLLDHEPGVDRVLAAVTGPTLPLARRARRDALRTLRGKVLRMEVYAQDGDPVRAERPYSVSETAYGLVELDAPDATNAARRRIFFPHATVTRRTQWERGDDPLTELTFFDYASRTPGGAAVFDPYGRIRGRTRVVMPRRSTRRMRLPGAPPGQGVLDETAILATHERTSYASPADADVYIHDRTSETRTYELAPAPAVVESDPASVVQILKDQYAAATAVVTIFDALSPAQVRLVAHTINHYDGPPFVGLDAGMLGRAGAFSRCERLAFTAPMLDAAYGERRPVSLDGALALPPGTPPGVADSLGYVVATTPDNRTGYYIQQQCRRTSTRGLITAERDPLGHESRVVYDGFEWMAAQVVDPFGNVTSADYNYRVQLPSSVTDPNGAVIRVTFTPTGPPAEIWTMGRPGVSEGDRTRPSAWFEYDFLAFVRSVPGARQPVRSRSMRAVHHDTEPGIAAAALEAAIVSCVYSDGFGRTIQTRTTGEDLRFGDAVFGGGDAVLPLSPSNPGDAPVAGIRNTSAARPNVVVSGWKIYDNKSRVVEQFEPYFDEGWDYAAPTAAQRGLRVRMEYDAVGRMRRTIRPDGSEDRVVFGTPASLQTPDVFSPSPWETSHYDANDLAPLSADPVRLQPDGSPVTLGDRASAAHHYTPTTVVVDGFGRRIVECHRAGAVPSTDWFFTRTSYDVLGNVTGVVDALGRQAFENAYDLTGRLLRAAGLDTGVRTSVFNAAGHSVEARDAKGGVELRRYDALNRMVELWASDGGGVVTLRERVHYVDRSGLQGFTMADASARNLLGRSWRHYDEAGLLETSRFDFKGNLLEKTRSVMSDAAVASGATPDWSSAAWATGLDGTRTYTISTTYDALNRTTSVAYPADAVGRRPVLTPTFDRAGALQSVALDGEPYVRHIAYNARGQRVLAVLGNGVMTRYAYDRGSFRLARFRTQPMTSSADGATFTPGATVLQDSVCQYDLAGNIVRIVDRSPWSGVRNNPDQLRWAASDPELAALIGAGAALVRDFEYDPLYRLTAATGREGVTVPSPRWWWATVGEGYLRAGVAAPTPEAAPDVTRTYRETYGYDPAGNLVSIRHTPATGNASTRQFGMGGLSPTVWDLEWRAHLNQTALWADAPGNAATHAGDDQPAVPATHQFDACGNLVQELSNRRYGWDHANRLLSFRDQATPLATPSVDARYLYGADGRRVKKWVRTGGVAANDESRVYVDGLVERHRWMENGAVRESLLVHVMDNLTRVALVRRGSRHADDTGPAVQYHIGDQVNSVSVVVGGSNAGSRSFVNREEYLPFGETAFGSFGRKRYRFIGRERDDESGLHYHVARYYAPWLGRWVSPDPAGPVEGVNLYRYARSSPVTRSDVNGRQSTGAEAPAAPSASVSTMGSDAPRPNEHHRVCSACHFAPQTPPHALSPWRAEALSRYATQQEASFEEAVSFTFDADKYRKAWASPAMNDVQHGLTPEQLTRLDKHLGKDNPRSATLLNLNRVESPLTLGLHTFSDFSTLTKWREVATVADGPTFNAGPNHQRDPGFVLETYLKNGNRPVPRNLADAFGHCYAACELSKTEGPETIIRIAREREAWREAGYKGGHDSFIQDVHNDSRGVLLYLTQGDQTNCRLECAQATSWLLDLSAPTGGYHQCSLESLPGGSMQFYECTH